MLIGQKINIVHIYTPYSSLSRPTNRLAVQLDFSSCWSTYRKFFPVAFYMIHSEYQQEYLLQFLSLKIDFDVYWEIIVTSLCTTSIPKQMPDITYQEKNGDVASTQICHFMVTWPNLLYPHNFLTGLPYELFSVVVQGSFGTTDTPSG